jgi:diguanylate cyclase (GGDEF)-like protein
MWESIISTGSWAGEIWNRRKNLEVYPEYLTITAVRNKDGDISNYVATLTDITLSKKAADEIKNLAFYDPLTNLSNRRLLQDRLFQALSSSDRNGKIGALLYIDLDNFKSINDTFGHTKGDQLLQQVAERLKSCVRIGDTVARLGGDEFVVMLENLNEQAIHAAAEAEVIGQKILVTLNQPYRLGSREFVNTPSIGVSLFNGHQQLADDLFKQADIAMYQAKNEGRNTLRFFDPKVQLAINHRVTLEGELRSAIEFHQFFLHYQIQVDHTNQPVGAEALIRWIHPTRDMVSPAEFIPIAEETGLILPIGKWVLDTACAQLSLWQLDVKTKDLMLSVNVSAKQFNQPDFAEQVREIVQRHGINPAKLKLELTESILLDNIERIISTMNEISALGIRFSLDDFGTGYSSLQYLKKLPLYQLKIDQSFVRDIVDDSNDRSIVDTIIGMARSLELEVIAEGVETEEQKKILEKSGCTHFQGYLFGKPMPINQFIELIK